MTVQVLRELCVETAAAVSGPGVKERRTCEGRVKAGTADATSADTVCREKPLNDRWKTDASVGCGTTELGDGSKSGSTVELLCCGLAARSVGAM